MVTGSCGDLGIEVAPVVPATAATQTMAQRALAVEGCGTACRVTVRFIGIFAQFPQTSHQPFAMRPFCSALHFSA